MSAVPVPPYEATVSDTVEASVTTVMASLSVAALVFALVYWWRTGRPTILALFFAGGAMVLLEPFVDVVGGCWHPNDLARLFTLDHAGAREPEGDHPRAGAPRDPRPGRIAEAAFSS